MRRNGYGLVIGVLALGTGVVVVPAAGAAEQVPCDTASLIAAIDRVNAANTYEQLQLTPGCTYRLTEPVGDDALPIGNAGLPRITGRVGLRGADVAIVRDEAAPRFRVFRVEKGALLDLDGITVSGGHTPDSLDVGSWHLDGGGIHNAGTTVLTRSTVSGNRTGNGGTGKTGSPGVRGQLGGYGGDGGGIYNDGGGATLRVLQSTVRNNVTGDGGTGGQGGHGLLLDTGYAWPAGAGSVGGNGGHGGGIYNGGTLELVDSTLEGNRTGAGGAGGAGGDGSDNPRGNPSKGAQGGTGGHGGNGAGLASDGTVTGSRSGAVRNTTGAGGAGGRGGNGGVGPNGGAGAGTPGWQEEHSFAGNGGNGGGFALMSASLTDITVVGNRTGAGGRGGHGGNAGSPEALAGPGTNGGYGGSGAGIVLFGVFGLPRATISGGRLADNVTGDGGAGGDGGTGGRYGTGGWGNDGGSGGGLVVNHPRAADIDHLTITGNRTGAGGEGGQVQVVGATEGIPGKRGTGGGISAGPFKYDPALLKATDLTVSGNRPNNCTGLPTVC
ncbi:hypothetical protein ABZ816_00230 [Actinosynnema sp. NPDC047251]|uniref:Polymorphic outer membrane protein n=1 Tax=Saccharothrix espanaensis (strain ATCC 51144 / DSM 44229 / JCM 9112 / NBRC 15066 / NRRL 15764) TaxID=1179773 RepID=K0K1E8_SACES|nr:hypothetical protein [Saccharothrix espanaensis]CCH30679.1 hypothetical protein BN6_33790 [Saccharothrix espanaensis DSM 44229]